jgi:hypothetical protein
MSRKIAATIIGWLRKAIFTYCGHGKKSNEKYRGKNETILSSILLVRTA